MWYYHLELTSCLFEFYVQMIINIILNAPHGLPAAILVVLRKTPSSRQQLPRVLASKAPPCPGFCPPSLLRPAIMMMLRSPFRFVLCVRRFAISFNLPSSFLPAILLASERLSDLRCFFPLSEVLQLSLCRGWQRLTSSAFLPCSCFYRLFGLLLLRNCSCRSSISICSIAPFSKPFGCCSSMASVVRVPHLPALASLNSFQFSLMLINHYGRTAFVAPACFPPTVLPSTFRAKTLSKAPSSSIFPSSSAKVPDYRAHPPKNLLPLHTFLPSPSNASQPALSGASHLVYPAWHLCLFQHQPR